MDYPLDMLAETFGKKIISFIDRSLNLAKMLIVGLFKMNNRYNYFLDKLNAVD